MTGPAIRVPRAGHRWSKFRFTGEEPLLARIVNLAWQRPNTRLTSCRSPHAERSGSYMSDEMVQEKTETAALATPENGHADGQSGEVEAVAAVSSPVAAGLATTDEPAPAHSVADTPAAT